MQQEFPCQFEILCSFQPVPLENENNNKTINVPTRCKMNKQKATIHTCKP